jgi:hypothetical protein
LAQTLYRPAHSALLPTLWRTPDELTSANVVRGLLDSVSDARRSARCVASPRQRGNRDGERGGSVAWRNLRGGVA